MTIETLNHMRMIEARLKRERKREMVENDGKMNQ